jgi:predicted ester cyclase
MVPTCPTVLVGAKTGDRPSACTVVFEELIVSGDTVVGRWNATATHTGQLPGVAPTGKPIAIGGITIYRIANGKIVEAWEQLDMLGMWQQLGVVTVPGRE